MIAICLRLKIQIVSTSAMQKQVLKIFLDNYNTYDS